MQAKHNIRYIPHPVHSLTTDLAAGITALLYVEDGRDVYGWYAQARRWRYSAAFFMLENFYSNQPTLLYRSLEDDVQGDWECMLPSPARPIRCPVPEEWRHELESQQSAFIDDWLFFPGDPAYRREVEACRQRGLPLHAFNVRPRRLGRMRAEADGWSHASQSCDPWLVEYLQKSWPFNGQELFLSPQASPQTAIRRYDEVAISSTKKGRN